MDDAPPPYRLTDGAIENEAWPRRLRRRGALGIVLLYVASGVLWIFFSDLLMETLLPQSWQGLVGTCKGFGYVFITGVLLYVLIQRHTRAMHAAEDALQQRLREVASQYKLLFEQSPSALVIYDIKDLRYLAVNDAAVLMYGYTREELLRISVYDILVKEELPRAQVAAANLPRKVENEGTWRIRRKDGRVLYVEAVGHVIEFQGKTVGISLVADVTDRLLAQQALEQHRAELEQRVEERTVELSRANDLLRDEVDERERMEAELRAATAAAETANVAKSTFLANTSHEIRTPLTSILGYADLLTDGSLAPGERTHYLDILQQNARHLLTLIDDLLDLSRAEMGKVRVALDDQSPREIARQAVELIRHRAVEKALTLDLEVAGEVPEVIHTDGVRVRQILLNLLSNALKFTPAGRVTLTLRGAGGQVQFDVADTGIGMSPEHLERVFEPFYQVEQGTNRRYPGSGLGLAISRQLAEQIGGTVSVQSELGKGACFSLVLPSRTRVEAGAEGGAPAGPGADLHGARILLAEDNPNIRVLVEEYLRRAGAKVVAVGDGAAALEAVRQALASGEGVDLVLLDLHMPVLDGMKAMQQMRVSGFAGPVVGLTADYANKSATEWARDGWDAMAAKPIDRAAFIPLLARMVEGRLRGAGGQKEDGPGIARTV